MLRQENKKRIEILLNAGPAAARAKGRFFAALAKLAKDKDYISMAGFELNHISRAAGAGFVFSPGRCYTFNLNAVVVYHFYHTDL